MNGSDGFSQPCYGPASSINACVLSPQVASGDEAFSNLRRDLPSHADLAPLAVRPRTERHDENICASGHPASSSHAFPCVARSDNKVNYKHNRQENGWRPASQAGDQRGGQQEYQLSATAPFGSYNIHIPADMMGDAAPEKSLEDAPSGLLKVISPGTPAGAPTGDADAGAPEEHGVHTASPSRPRNTSTHSDRTRAPDTARLTTSRAPLTEPTRVELEETSAAQLQTEAAASAAASTGSPVLCFVDKRNASSSCPQKTCGESDAAAECVRLRDELRILNDAYAKQTEALLKEQNRSALLQLQCEALQTNASELQDNVQRVERHYERMSAQVKDDEEDRKVIEDAAKNLTFDDLDCDGARAELDAVLRALDEQDISPDAAIMRVFKSSNATLLKILQALQREVKRAECRLGELRDDKAEVRLQLELEKKKNQGLREELAYHRVNTTKGGEEPGAVLLQEHPHTRFVLRCGVAQKVETVQRPVKVHRYGKNSAIF